MLERLFSFINRDHHKKDWLIEKMIRIILQKNPHFAIWPEGRSPLDGRIMYGFSSVAKVYATLNSQRDIIPLVPVLIEGSGCYRYNLWPRTNKITLRFLPAYYLPREWLLKPDDGGKAPREIVDYMMSILAKARGQKHLLYNDRIDHHRQRYQKLDSHSRLGIN
jgi:hypothetical protein